MPSTPSRSRSSRSQSSSAAPPERRLSLLLLLVAAHQRMTQLVEQELAADGVSADGYAMLSLIGVRQPVRLTELANDLGLPLTTASDVVRRLETRRYVRRHENPADARSWLFELSPAGDARMEARLRRAAADQRAARAGARQRCRYPRGADRARLGLRRCVNRRLIRIRSCLLRFRTIVRTHAHRRPDSGGSGLRVGRSRRVRTRRWCVAKIKVAAGAAPCAAAGGGGFVWVSEYGVAVSAQDQPAHEQGRQEDRDRRRLVRARLRRRVALDRGHELEHGQPRRRADGQAGRRCQSRLAAVRCDVRLRLGVGHVLRRWRCRADRSRAQQGDSALPAAAGDRAGRRLRLGLGRRAGRRRPHRPRHRPRSSPGSRSRAEQAGRRHQATRSGSRRRPVSRASTRRRTPSLPRSHSARRRSATPPSSRARSGFRRSEPTRSP